MLLPSISILLLVVALGATLGWGWRGRRAARRAQAGGSEEAAALQAANAAQAAQLRHVQNQLDEMHRELSALSYSISHDLRAPLRSIGGFAQALAEDYGATLDATAHDTATQHPNHHPHLEHPLGHRRHDRSRALPPLPRPRSAVKTVGHLNDERTATPSLLVVILSEAEESPHFVFTDGAKRRPSSQPAAQHPRPQPIAPSLPSRGIYFLPHPSPPSS